MTFTKLMRILLFVTIITIVWLAFVTESIPMHMSPSAKEVMFASPIYMLMAFACYSLGTVGYRVATFNDCDAASDELKQQVTEAKKDLSQKGFVFS